MPATPRPHALKSRTVRYCVHCGHNGRGLLAVPYGGWIHPQCLRVMIEKPGSMG